MNLRVRLVPLLTVALAGIVLCVSSCGRNGEKEQLQRDLAHARSEADHARKQQKTEQQRTKVLALRLEAAQQDSAITASIAFGCVLGFVLVVVLLIREQRSRKALVTFLKWAKGRCVNGKPTQ